MAVVPGPRRETATPDAQAGPSRTGARADLPDATIARLPLYHRVLAALADSAEATVSSEELAALAGVSPAMLRKDLSYLGSYGTRGVGYDIDVLLHQIGRELGLAREWPVVIVGVGNLGEALANYGGFASRGFRLAALVDADPRRVGAVVAGLVVTSSHEIGSAVRETNAVIGVIATPANAAQRVCDDLVAAGIRSILNFAPAVLTVPDHVEVRQVDLASELQILAFHELRKTGAWLTERPAQPEQVLA